VDERLTVSKGRNWVRVDLTVEEAESLLRTEYHVYTNTQTGKEHLACDEYSVPPHITEHLDFITPTIQFDATVKQKPKRDLSKREMKVRPFPIAVPGPEVAPSPQVTYNLANCYEYTTPDCLRALYNFSNGTLAQSSYGIVEYTPNTYLQTDLNIFYTNLARQIPSGTGPTVDLIDGATTQGGTESFDNNGESDLDLQYAIALGKPSYTGFSSDDQD
jgi:tripeptidyl-peptidase-1